MRHSVHSLSTLRDEEVDIEYSSIDSMHIHACSVEDKMTNCSARPSQAMHFSQRHATWKTKARPEARNHHEEKRFVTLARTVSLVSISYITIQ